MSWVKLDDQFHSHPKVLAAGNEAAGVYARALAYCGAYYTDGFVSRVWARTIAGVRVLDRVTRSGLWIEVQAGEWQEVVLRKDSGGRKLDDVTLKIMADGFFIPDYLHHNPTRLEVEAARAKKKSAGSKGGEASAQAGAVADAQAPAKQVVQQNASNIPDPDPALPQEIQEQSSNGLREVDERVFRLLKVCRDADDGTPGVLRKYALGRSESEIAFAIESARGPGVVSPTAVAVAYLKQQYDASRYPTEDVA